MLTIKQWNKQGEKFNNHNNIKGKSPNKLSRVVLPWGGSKNVVLCDSTKMNPASMRAGSFSLL